MLAQFFFGCRFEHLRSRRAIKPRIEILRLQQHRHAVVIGRHPGAGTRDDDRGGNHLVEVFRIDPAIPEPGEGKHRRAVGRREEMRLARGLRSRPLCYMDIQAPRPDPRCFFVRRQPRFRIAGGADQPKAAAGGRARGWPEPPQSTHSGYTQRRPGRLGLADSGMFVLHRVVAAFDT